MTKFVRSPWTPLAGAALVATSLAVTGCNPSTSSTSGSSSAPPSSAPSASGSAPSSETGESPAAGSSRAGSSGSDSGCTTAHLSVTAEKGQGAAGTLLQTLDFTNTGSTSCTLSGYPGVALADDAGAVGASATRSGGSYKLVTLAPGAKAYVLLKILTNGVYPDSKCRPTPVKALQVFPPGQTQSLTVPDKDLSPDRNEGCQSDSAKLLTIGSLASTEDGARF